MQTPSREEQIRYLIEQEPFWSRLDRERELWRKRSDDLWYEYLASKASRERDLQQRRELNENDRFFHQPNAIADLTYWSGLAIWTLDEAVALSFGKAPELVNRQKVEPLLAQSVFASRYMRRYEHVRRAVAAKQLSEQISPREFVTWAKSAQVAVPSQLEELALAQGAQRVDWKSEFEHAQVQIANQQALRKENSDLKGRAGDAATTTKIGTLLKLVHGMATQGYRFDGTASRSPVLSEIAGDTALAGCPVGEDTVRKWLREAWARHGEGAEERRSG